jgi:hypothetical protein
LISSCLPNGSLPATSHMSRQSQQINIPRIGETSRGGLGAPPRKLPQGYCIEPSDGGEAANEAASAAIGTRALAPDLDSRPRPPGFQEEASTSHDAHAKPSPSPASGSNSNPETAYPSMWPLERGRRCLHSRNSHQLGQCRVLTVSSPDVFSLTLSSS